jgi:hypothetical protein
MSGEGHWESLVEWRLVCSGTLTIFLLLGEKVGTSNVRLQRLQISFLEGVHMRMNSTALWVCSIYNSDQGRRQSVGSTPASGIHTFGFPFGHALAPFD